MSSLQAAAAPAQGKVTLTLTWPGVTSANIVRTDPDGTQVPVRNATPAAVSAGSWVGIDWEAPPASTVTYTARSSSTSQVLTRTVKVGDIPGKHTWLKHPGKPFLNRLLTAVAGVPKLTRAANRDVLQPWNVALPVALSMTRRAPSGTLSFLSQSEDELQAVLDLIEDGATLLLQTASHFGLGSWWVSFGDVDEDRLRALFGADPGRTWTLPFDVVARPAGDSAGGGRGNTVADLITAYATVADLAGSGRTVGDLAVSVTPPATP